MCFFRFLSFYLKAYSCLPNVSLEVDFRHLSLPIASPEVEVCKIGVQRSREKNNLKNNIEIYIFSKETSSTTFQLYSCFIRRFISN